jgi:putative ATP-dependent endonuclease of the OLD family
VYISAIRIENFRLFGSGKDAFQLSFKPGLTAIVGENDAGKTALIDALRFVLGTRDQESLRVEIADFYQAASGERAAEIKIQLVFSGLTTGDRSTFAEYLTYRLDASSDVVLVLTWVARRAETDGPVRRFMPTEWRTGEKADGPLLDAGARFLLQATYLRPLRDAERAMSAGRGSRLSQILQHTKEIKEHGVGFDRKAIPPLDPTALSVLGLGDYTSHLIENSHGVKRTRQKLNNEYLRHLSFSGDPLDARVGISSHRDDGTRLRQLLEKLEVNLSATELVEETHGRGLGSNNILFMACELLLLGAEADGFPLLLIEEPEAHLHPQRQLRLMAFLQAQASKAREDGQCIQIIVTTHSPNLASDVKLDNLVLIRDGHGYSMAEDQTKLTKSDYSFLQRFLDVTKANLFFARGVVIVEGDAENILLPVIAKLIGRDFEQYGVSVVNVGGVGLSRYGRIFMREKPETDGQISIPVACLTDMDVMPDCAPLILEKINAGELIPPLSGSKRRWRVKSDFKANELEERRAHIRDKANEQYVRTFVANEWTLEYDLAYFGLAQQVHIAVAMADADDKINEKKLKLSEVAEAASKDYDALVAQGLAKENLCSLIYKPLAVSNPVSKPTTAQCLSALLDESGAKDGKLTPERLRERLPPYLVDAIVHVTEPFAAAGTTEQQLPPQDTVTAGTTATATDREAVV